MKRKRNLKLILALALLVQLAACGGEPEVVTPAPTLTSTPTPATDGKGLDFVLPCYPAGGFHPITGSNRLNLTLAPLLYRGLFSLDSGFTPQNDLCESYTVSEDGLTWTFTLKEAAFSDGTALTAAEVIASLNKARQSDRYSSRLADLTKVGVGEGGAVTVTLSRPNGALPSLLDVPVVKESGDPLRPLGTGPYFLSESEETGELVLTAREGEQVPLTQIPLRSVSTGDDLVYAFDAREISLVDVDLNSTNALGYSGRMETTDYPTTTLLYLGFNMENGLCRENSLRRALSLAFDRETMVERIFAGHGEAAALPIHPNSSLYDAGVATQALWNEEEAVRLLENAGWRLEEDGIRENRRSRLALKLIVNQENTAKAALADALAESLQRLGCDVTVDKLPWEDFSAALNRGSFDLYLGETVLTADFDLEDLLRTRGALNYGGCADGELDAWMDAYRAAAGEERQAAASTLWEQVTQVAPMVPLVFKNGSLLTQWGQVRGMAPTQRDVFFGLEGWQIVE